MLMKKTFSKNNKISHSQLEQSVKINMDNKKKINLKKISKIAFGLGLFLLVGGSGFVIGKYDVKGIGDFGSGIKNELSDNQIKQVIDKEIPRNKSVSMDVFWQVWDQIEANYLFEEKIDYEKMIEGAIVGMASSMDDPYTAFFPPQKNQTFNENLNGAFFGVGIQLGYRLGDQLSVIAPLSGMPGEKAGIQAGDFILKIVDEGKGVDKDTYGMSLQEAVELIRGEEGSKVKLTLLHEGERAAYEVEIVREEIITPSVEVRFGQVIEGNFTTEATASGGMMAHLQLAKFGELTDEQWDEAIDEIVKRKDVEGVILDVRNNPGGYVTAAVNLAAEFLPKGVMVVKQEQRGEPDRRYNTQRFGRLLEMPLVVLVNKGSASASEIIAGALRDYNRAKLVGNQTFGKGTMQSPIDIVGAEGASLHVTVARWLTPKETWVNEGGLEPDMVVDLDKDNPTVDTQLIKAVELIETGEWEIE